MPLLNYTTKVDADKTASEIARCLSMHGAQAVMTEYDQKDGYVTALSFKILLEGRSIAFRLPCDWRPVVEVLAKGKRQPPKYDERRYNAWIADRREQAVRVAWRIVKDWVEAQMALVETKMVTTQQVFLPYAVMQNGRTFAENVADKPEMFLGDGK